MKNSDKRTEIMHVALELLAEQGFHRVPMSMIARKAGVAVGTIYLYFESKDKLIAELFQDLERRILEVIRAGKPAGMGIRERFLHVTRAIMRYFMDNPIEFRYVEQYMNSPYGICMQRDKILGKQNHDDVFKMLLEEGIQHQVVKELPTIVLFSISFGPVIFLIRDHILGFVDMNETLIRQTTEACWDAIKR